MGEPEEKLSKYEFNLVLSTLETELWTRDVQREYTQSPMPYVFPLWLIEGSYTSRSFAPLETRVRSLTSLLEALPEMYDQARDQL
ncbi:MAG: hypothetical protein IH840_04035 [Candidatus Heimdallarchaeota archaeon]|nr:hypothetical protein [Candidatus Heimdallarchaeota archaeon]